ncbi:hypothetical protein ACWF0M_01220 [Kribbella sp. NPDC055110]
MRLRAAAAVLVIAVLAGGCDSADDWSRPHAKPMPIGALREGFVDPAAPPSPEATITPRAGSWGDVRPPEGYRVVLLTAGDNAETKTLATAVHEWAASEKVSLKTVNADAPAQYVTRISDAIKLSPDLVVAAGNALVDPMALITASHLDQQFLVLGAELAEPTANVTAATWPGASYRGEGLGTSTGYDAKTFTPIRAATAIRAGAAAVLTTHTGIVLQLP